ncbi:nucleotide exchange factor GrpE [Candidatus Saccharibacteria bacterium]|nr:nucleotide exchange factor GrpE [Candidatus Saccharibacteria bacterium]
MAKQKDDDKPHDDKRHERQDKHDERNQRDEQPRISSDDALATIENLEQQLGELTIDLQRTRADFENYRKRTETDKENAKEQGRALAILKLLPVVDTIERAVAHAPQDLQDNKWVQGVQGLAKQLEKSLEALGLTRIDAAPGTPFDPELHEAISSEEGDGDEEVVSEELQAGYKLGDRVIRHSMVKVKH